MPVTTYSECMAARVLELQAELTSVRREVRRARQSRDIWKARYTTAAAAAHRLQRNYYRRAPINA